MAYKKAPRLRAPIAGSLLAILVGFTLRPRSLIDRFLDDLCFTLDYVVFGLGISSRTSSGASRYSWDNDAICSRDVIGPPPGPGPDAGGPRRKSNRRRGNHSRIRTQGADVSMGLEIGAEITGVAPGL